MQSRGRYHSRGDYERASELYRASPPGLGGSDGQTARGIRSLGRELRRSSAVPRQSPQSTRARNRARKKRRG